MIGLTIREKMFLRVYFSSVYAFNGNQFIMSESVNILDYLHSKGYNSSLDSFLCNDGSVNVKFYKWACSFWNLNYGYDIQLPKLKKGQLIQYLRDRQIGQAIYWNELQKVKRIIVKGNKIRIYHNWYLLIKGIR